MPRSLPIDIGVVPAVGIWPPDVLVGRSVKWVDRMGVVQIDREAFEQGE